MERQVRKVLGARGEGEGTNGFSWLRALREVERSLFVMIVVSSC